MRKALVIELRGGLYGFAAEGIEQGIRYWAGVAGSGAVILDLSDLCIVDSMGLETLVRMAAMRNVVLCSPSADMQQMMSTVPEISGLAIYHNVGEVLARLGLELASAREIRGERRRCPRIGLCATTRFKARGGKGKVAFRGVISNISMSGALVEYLDNFSAARPFAFSRGMPIEGLELFNIRQGLAVAGTLERLSYDHSQMGIGVRFSSLMQGERWPIARYIERSSRIKPRLLAI